MVEFAEKSSLETFVSLSEVARKAIYALYWTQTRKMAFLCLPYWLF
jgi:hypothetical protein